MCNAFLLKNSEPCENNAIYFRGSSLSYKTVKEQQANFTNKILDNKYL